MSITDTFDDSAEVILPSDMYTENPHLPRTAVMCFTRRFLPPAALKYRAQAIDRLYGGMQDVAIYALDYSGTRLAFAVSMLGASAAVACMEELIAKGVKRFVYFGSCGALSEQLEPGRLLLPTAAYRDEGTSYHYAPASDYIEIPSSKRLGEVLTKLNVKYTPCRVWTTDGFYRETRANMLKRRGEGCLAVDMECAALAAAAAYRGVEYYQYLFTEDSLAGEAWDPRVMGRWTDEARAQLLGTALAAAAILNDAEGE